MRNFLARLGYRLGWLLANNNGRCLALWIVTGAFLVMGILSGFGEPVLTHTIDKKISEIPQSKYHQSVYDAWYAPERIKAELSGEKWPVAKKPLSLLWSWKWWLGFILFFFISLIYTPIAYREEIWEMGRNAWRKAREKREAEAKEKETQGKGEGVAQSTESGSGRNTFAKQLGLEFAAEFLAEMTQKVIRRR